FASDVGAKQLGGPSRLLVLVVTGPIREGVPRELRDQCVERDERFGRGHRGRLVANAQQTPVAAWNERLLQSRLALVQPCGNEIAARRACVEGQPMGELVPDRGGGAP